MMIDKYVLGANLKQRINTEQAFHYRIVPINFKDERLFLITDTANHESLKTELEIILNIPVSLESCESKELDNYLYTNYRRSKETNKNLNYTSDFLEKILYTAKEIGSSDIHFEPYESYCRVRFRLDGKLLEQYRIPLNEYPIIINKIKIKAELDISEKRLPQDGRISMKSDMNEFDIRVSSLPTMFGEKLVLRILTKETTIVEIEKLGFSKKELLIYKEALRKPNGIILISGPTGSGKTTTLYATLQLLNNPETNIYTIEDPIEYTLEGVNQVQVKENIGFNFSKALRTFLRQDPNIIMVGEIRDTETANMAIRTALIGRLVLSTIHTNSAWATISRLVDMGVPPFLISTTLNISVAQRLVRLLCNRCKIKGSITPGLLPKNINATKHFKEHYLAKGCSYCHHTGYQGRKAIYEIIPITRELVNYIRDNVSHIDKYLEENNIKTLRENALQMVEAGITSIDEVYTLLAD